MNTPGFDVQHTFSHEETQRALNQFQTSTMALCIRIFQLEKVSRATVNDLAGSAKSGSLDARKLASLSPRAQRALRAYWACHALQGQRTGFHRKSRKLARQVDDALFSTVLAAHFMAHLGEDRMGVMEDLAEYKISRADLSRGGVNSGPARVEWRTEMRRRYDQHRRDYPQIAVATTIAENLLAQGRFAGLPSDKQVTEVVRDWNAEVGGYKKQKPIR